jgi:hypothetical protein
MLRVNRRRSLAGLFALVLALGATTARAADDPAKAPTTTTSADGKSVSDGRRTLSVSQARDIKPEGQTLTVDGKGYDNTKGIYVAFCVVPAPNKPPGPCGGGQDRSGTSGESVWISSNPPLYARGLTTPYGKGGTFHVEMHVQAQLNDNVDCRKVVCAITTRNDHTRSSDRSQDMFVPLHFVGGVTPTTAAKRVTTTTAAKRITSGGGGAATIAPSGASMTAPLATVSDDRKSVTGAGMTLAASRVDGLKRGSQVHVNGTGYNATKGVYVSLCFINETSQPGPCASGSPKQSAWISNNPPQYAKGYALPYGKGGTFAVTLTLDPVIDTDHDCAVVACALASRNDDSHPDDHSQDLLLPVSFTATKKAVVQDGDTDSNGTIRFALGIVALVAAGGVAFAMRKARA